MPKRDLHHEFGVVTLIAVSRGWLAVCGLAAIAAGVLGCRDKQAEQVERARQEQLKAQEQDRELAQRCKEGRATPQECGRLVAVKYGGPSRARSDAGCSCSPDDPMCGCR